MLCLSREIDQYIDINGGAAAGGITIRVLEIYKGGTRVRLGFQAAPDISIHRREVQQQIDAHGARRPQPPGASPGSKPRGASPGSVPPGSKPPSGLRPPASGLNPPATP